MECPKCHHKIGKFDWGQSCKYCGTNLMYYNLEETMKSDAKHAEFGFARMRVSAYKAKAVFVGGALPIIRLIMLLGCVGLLMIPFGSAELKTGLFPGKLSFGFMDAYNVVTGGGLAELKNVSDSLIGGPLAAKSYALYLCIFALGVIGILQLVAVIISIRNPKKFSFLVAGFAGIGVIGSGVAAILSSQLSSAAQVSSVLAQGKMGVGAFAAMAGFAVMLVLNIIMGVKGIKVPFKDGDLYRVEMFRKVKKGEVKIESLSLPLFETEEEKQERLAEEEQANIAEKEETVNG